MTFNPNTIIYLIAVAYNDSPSINFTYRYYENIPPVVEVVCPGAFYYVSGVKICNNTTPVTPPVTTITKIDTKP